MFIHLERHWPKLALLLTLTFFAGLLFAPALVQGFAMPLLLLTLGMHGPAVAGPAPLAKLSHWQAIPAGTGAQYLHRNRLPAAGFRAGAAGWRACGRVCWLRLWSFGRLRSGLAADTVVCAAGRRGGGSRCPQDAGAVGEIVKDRKELVPSQNSIHN